MPKGIPLTEEEQARRQREIFEAALHLFLEKGFAETSMREIAQAAGVGKSTLYDYFQTKDDILVTYFLDEIQIISRRAEAINAQDLPAAEKLHQLMGAHLEYLLEYKDTYIALTIEAQRLGPQAQKRLQVARHTYQNLICGLVEQGTREGSFRPVNPLLAMRVILASLTPMVFTTRPTGTPQEMLAEALDLILNGIRR